MIQKNLEAGLESKLALERVLNNPGISLTEQESEEKIADSLVSVVGLGAIIKKLAYGSTVMESKGVGTGLLLTTDGWIVTAYHNIKKYETDWKRINEKNPPTEANIHAWMEHMKWKYAVVDKQGASYPIDIGFSATNPAFDIAIIKAVILKKPKPIGFKIAADDLEVGDEIKLLGLRDRIRYNQYGQVVSAGRNALITLKDDLSTTYDTFLTDAYSVPGFSGGAFITLHGEFAGICSYSQKDENKEIGRAGGAKVRHIANLIRYAVYELNRLDRADIITLNSKKQNSGTIKREKYSFYGRMS